MKKQFPLLTALLITLCFILFNNGLMYAQKYTYKPLALEGAHWWVGFTDTNFPPWEPTDFYQYVIRGDTVVDETSYKKVYYRELTDQSPHLIEYEILSRLVRDDTLNKKVYTVFLDYLQWNCPVNEDVLLYNFDLNIGDTMNTCLIHSGPAIIQSIVYEFIYGEERKLLYDFSGKFIEGIGSDFGVFEWGLGSKEVFKQERGWFFELLDYCLGTDEECSCQWVDIEERDKISQLKIYPNPLTGNTITLVPHTPITQPMDVKLYDITGRKIYQQHFENMTQEVIIQIPARLSSGSSPLLLWAGNSRQVFIKQLIVKQ